MKHAPDRPLLGQNVVEPSARQIFGREREQHALAQLLREQGSPSALIEGEAGIGKTALLLDAKACGVNHGLRVLRGQCYEGQDGGPYFPFFQIFSQLALTDASWDEAGSALRADSLGDPGSAWLGTDARAARTRLLRSLSGLIVELGQQSPVLIVVDDLQWADVGSLLLINHLVDIAVPQVLLFLAARTDEDGHDPEATHLLMRLRQKALHIQLEGLDLAAVSQLVEQRLGAGHLVKREVLDLAVFTKGNPLFVQELLEQIRRADLSRERVSDLLEKERSPHSLTAMIDLRLRRLSQPVQDAVRAASVIAGPVSAGLIAHLVQSTADDARERLRAAAAERVIRREPQAGPLAYVLEHDLYRKRLYEQQSLEERRVLHARAVSASRVGIIALDADQMARHSVLGGDSADDAVAACRRAAEDAEKMLAFDAAARSWELALERSADLDERVRADLWRRLGWSLWAAGKWTQAVSAWNEAVARYDVLDDQERVGEISLALADVHRWRLELADAGRWAARAASLPLVSVEDRALACTLLGSVASLQNRPAQARPLLDEAASLWEEGPCHPTVTWWLSHGYLMLGELRRANEIAKEGLDEAQRRNAASIAALLAGGLVANDVATLDRESALEHLRILEENISPYDVGARVLLVTYQAFVYGSAGEWRKVLELIDEWTAEFRLAGQFQVATVRMMGAAALLALGETGRAEEHIRMALPHTETMRQAASLYLAEACLLQGNEADACALVAECAEDVLVQPRLAASRGLLGHVATRLDDRSLWQRCYEALARERRALVMTYHCTSVQRVLGRLAARLHNWPAAIEHFDAALAQLERGEVYAELAVAFYDYAAMRRARRRRGDATKAAALETRAAALCERLGLPAPEPGSPIEPHGNAFALTGRELEVLQLAAGGLGNREIATKLSLSARTIQRHMENIYDKMEAAGRTEAVVKAAEAGLIRPRST